MNWKTTICGLVMAVAQALQTYTSPNHSWKGYLVAAGMAAFGFLSKDFDQL